ncbi:hypothetical protein Tco_0705132 [Tanacetum coccineum]|uniref:Uncharacterized protein n=1 Tax=Tanacetum coccineum TaxID=301880 RepID=A0ABQ4Y4L3_9ASTR
MMTNTMMLILRGRIVRRGGKRLNREHTQLVNHHQNKLWKKNQILQAQEEISREVDETQLKKVVDDMLRQRCNSGEEHQYHVDQMQNYLKNDIVWESRKERLSMPTLKKPALVFQSCQRDLKAPPMTLLNQDLFYLKFGHEHKFITEIIVRRANRKIDPIKELDYKYLNKNDIEDLKEFMISNYTWRVTSRKSISLLQQSHSLRVLEKLKKYNKDVKYGYANPSPMDANA